MSTNAQHPQPDARGRIIEVAYSLFAANGIRAVGIDRIIAESGVAKMTLYRHFPSKQDLVLAFLAERRRRWSDGWLRPTAERLAATPSERALAVLDALTLWFNEPDFCGCPFVRTLHEHPAGTVREAAARELEHLRELLREYAAHAGAHDPEALSHALQILMLGAIVAATGGDRQAAARARPPASLVIAAGR